MPFTTVRDGDSFVRYGLDDATGEWVRFVDDVEVERREATEHEASNFSPSLPPSLDLPPAIDLAALADEVVATRARLEAAEDALFFLLTDSLEMP